MRDGVILKQNSKLKMQIHFEDIGHLNLFQSFDGRRNVQKAEKVAL